MHLQQSRWLLCPPRRWQSEAYDILRKHLDQPRPGACVIQAVMGSGKSILAAEIITGALHPEETVVVSTPTVALVDQLAKTIQARLEAEGYGAGSVGRYYTHAKDSHTPVVVTCIPSAAALAARLREEGRRCRLLLADECHRTESLSMRKAVLDLTPDATVGFSATPFRAREDEALSCFDSEIYRYGPVEALRDGVIVPWEVRDWTGGQVLLDDACCRMIREADGPGIVNARSIRDAENFARTLKRAGIPARPVHSGMTRARIDSAIGALEQGDLKCLVHVALLQEGVDLPWLRWLCLRRNVSSRVRFAQEVGRALRAHPSKSVALVLDPLDLCSTFRLSYEAVLGWESPFYAVSKHGEAEAFEYAELTRQIMVGGNGIPAAALSEIESRLKGMVIQFDQAGMIDSNAIWPTGNWRSKPAHPLQLTHVVRYRHLLGYPIIPPVTRRFLKTVASKAGRLSRGGAADLLTVLVALDQHRRWPDLAAEAEASAA